MKFTRKLLIKTIALIAIAATLKITFSTTLDQGHGYVDVRAALLVFGMPLFVLILFDKGGVQWRSLLNRVREAMNLETESLRQQLEEQTSNVTGQYASSHILKLTESHSDSFVRYAGGLVTARFHPEELSQLLSQKIEAEDLEWQGFAETLSFLAKMAPYFGMLATVVGMVRLLENMNDFSKISGSMALAMQGTLYGLISFTLVYSPILKMLSSWRDHVRQRNEMIAHWFVLIASKADSAFIREDLKSTSFQAEQKVTSDIQRKVVQGSAVAYE